MSANYPNSPHEGSACVFPLPPYPPPLPPPYPFFVGPPPPSSTPPPYSFFVGAPPPHSSATLYCPFPPPPPPPLYPLPPCVMHYPIPYPCYSDALPHPTSVPASPPRESSSPPPRFASPVPARFGCASPLSSPSPIPIGDAPPAASPHLKPLSPTALRSSTPLRPPHLSPHLSLAQSIQGSSPIRTQHSSVEERPPRLAPPSPLPQAQLSPTPRSYMPSGTSQNHSAPILSSLLSAPFTAPHHDIALPSRHSEEMSLSHYPPTLAPPSPTPLGDLSLDLPSLESASPGVSLQSYESAVPCSSGSPNSTTSATERPERPPRERFFGERQVSKRGKHDVLIYRIPGTRHSYTFARMHVNKLEKVYRCQNCHNTSTKTRTVTIKVVGNEFLVDPCSIGHECRPGKYAEEKANRIVYKKLQCVRKDPKYAKKKPLEIFKELMAGHYDADKEVEDEIRDAIRRSGYQHRRRSIVKSVQRCRRILSVTESFNSDGESPENQQL